MAAARLGRDFRRALPLFEGGPADPEGVAHQFVNGEHGRLLERGFHGFAERRLVRPEIEHLGLLGWVDPDEEAPHGLVLPWELGDDLLAGDDAPEPFSLA